MTAEQLANLLAENKSLRESRDARPVFERAIVPANAITRLADATVAEGAKGGGKYRVAKVAQADKMNQNRRVYPRVEVESQVNYATPTSIPQGKLTGAVDHVGMLEGGNLKNTPILWKSLSLGEDGAVTGEFEIVDTTAGKDLQKQLEAGMAIGFSTMGYARGRKPTDAERAQYGIAEDDEYATILYDWKLKKIDAVDDPSVADAWDKKENAQRDAALREGRDNPQPQQQEPKTMKTLAELKAAYPEVFAAHEAAVAAAVKAASEAKDAEKQSAVAALTVERDGAVAAKAAAEKASTDAGAKLATAEKSLADLKGALASTVKSLGESHGVEIPFREVSEKEAAEKIAALEAQVAAGAAKVAEADAKVTALAAEKAAADAAKVVAEAAAADVARKDGVKAKAAELLTGNQFAERINALVASQLDDKAFDVAKAEAFVKAKTAEYAEVAAAASAVKDPSLGITGMLNVPAAKAEEANKGNAGKGALSVASQI